VTAAFDKLISELGWVEVREFAMLRTLSARRILQQCVRAQAFERRAQSAGGAYVGLYVCAETGCSAVDAATALGRAWVRWHKEHCWRHCDLLLRYRKTSVL